MITFAQDFDLSSRNTFRMRAKCALFVEISKEEDLPQMDWDSLPKPLLVIGGGSNLLFTGEYFPGTVLHVNIGGIGETCGAGTVFDEFCAWASSQGLWGPENLSLIPGEVGASAVQNIGAYGVEANDIITSIRAWDLQEKRFVEMDPSTCDYGYRTSNFKTQWKGRFIITAVSYALSREPNPRLEYGGIRKALEGAPQPLSPKVIRDTIIGIRNSKLPDPAVLGSAGSFFCNPVISKEHFERVVATAREENGPLYEVPHYLVGDGVKVPAAWLIEQCGFKGKRKGGARVYPGQPLVIVNESGTAPASDILSLEKEIIDTIAAKYGITLHPEVEHI